MSNFSDILSGHTDSLLALHQLSVISEPLFMWEQPFKYISPKNTGLDYCGNISGEVTLGNQKLPIAELSLTDLMQPHLSLPPPQALTGKQMRAWHICSALNVLLGVFFQVSIADLRGRHRGTSYIARVRQFGMYIAHTMFGLTMAEVADAFARERTTVKHACHLIEDLRDNAEFDRGVSAFEYFIRMICPYAGVSGDE